MKEFGIGIIDGFMGKAHTYATGPCLYYEDLPFRIRLVGFVIEL